MPISGYFDTPFAATGDRASVPDAAQTDGSMSYQQGYTPPYGLAPSNPAAILVPRNQTNQLYYDITKAIQYIQQNGAAPFITTAMNGGVTPYSYVLGAVVSYDAGSGLQNWLSTAASNTTTPGAVGASWVTLGSSSNPYTGGTSTGTANAQTVTTTHANFTSAAGNIVTFKAGASVTSSSTLTVDGTTLAMKVMGQSGLRDTVTGDVVTGGEYMLIDNGTSLQLVNPSSVLQANLNLSDLGNIATALTNLGFVFGLGTNGYIKVPNPGGGDPLIIQWGKYTISGTSTTFDFPIAFTNSSYIDPIICGTGSATVFGAVTISTTQFTASCNPANAPFSMIVIGH